MYKPLLDIRVEHPFFEAGVCFPARVIPSEATASRLRGLRLLHRALPGGIALAVDLAKDGTPKVPIDSSTLRFELCRLEGEILAATDLKGIAEGTVFTDAGADKPMKPAVREARASETIVTAGGSSFAVLKGKPLDGASASDFKILSPPGASIKGYEAGARRIKLEAPAGPVEFNYPVAPSSSPGSLAAIEIALGPDLVAKAAAGKPRRFTIALKAAAAPWCYHLVTDLPNPLGDWRIEHPAKDGPPAAFGGSISEISAPDPADSFGTELLRRSSPLRVLRFVSDAPVQCSETRARRVALFAGTRQLFTALPNPSPRQVRILGGKPVFGELLRYVTA